MYNTLTFERSIWNVFLEAWYYFCTAFDNLRSLQYEKLNILSERNVRTPSLHRRPRTGSSAELSGASSHNLRKWGPEYVFTLAIRTCRFRTCTYRMPTVLCHFLWGTWASIDFGIYTSWNHSPIGYWEMTVHLLCQAFLSGQNLLSIIIMKQIPTHVSGHRSYSSCLRKFFLTTPGRIKHLLLDIPCYLLFLPFRVDISKSL